MNVLYILFLSGLKKIVDIDQWRARPSMGIVGTFACTECSTGIAGTIKYN